jgi:ribonuclease P protein component
MVRRLLSAAGQKDGIASRFEVVGMKKKTVSPAAKIRRCGAKVHGGPWTIFSAPGMASPGKLIVALGRRAGGAVVRSRIRRIARDVYSKAGSDLLGVDFLLAVRSDVGQVPRCRVRGVLQGLFRRGHEAAIRRGTI